MISHNLAVLRKLDPLQLDQPVRSQYPALFIHSSTAAGASAPAVAVHKASTGLVHLLLLINAELAWSTVDQEQETADNGEDLEEVVLGEVLVGVVLVKL